MRAPCSGADAQFAPAGTDLQHTATRSDPSRVEQPVDLAPLRVGQPCRVAGQLEQRAGIGHRLVEEHGEQFVGEVVVLGDVAPGLRGLLCCEAEAERRRSAEAVAAQRNQVGHRLGELGEQPGEVVGTPFAGHIGLAEADQAVAADPAGHRLRPVNHHRRQRRVGGADDRAVRVDQPHRQPCRRAAEQPVGDRPRHGAQRPIGNAGHIRPTLGIDCGADCSGDVDAHSCSTLSHSSLDRGTTGTRRSHSVMP